MRACHSNLASSSFTRPKIVNTRPTPFKIVQHFHSESQTRSAQLGSGAVGTKFGYVGIHWWYPGNYQVVSISRGWETECTDIVDCGRRQFEIPWSPSPLMIIVLQCWVPMVETQVSNDFWNWLAGNHQEGGRKPPEMKFRHSHSLSVRIADLQTCTMPVPNELFAQIAVDSEVMRQPVFRDSSPS